VRWAIWRPDIAGFLNHLLQGQGAVTMGVMDHFLGSQTPEAHFAVEGVSGLGGVGIKAEAATKILKVEPGSKAAVTGAPGGFLRDSGKSGWDPPGEIGPGPESPGLGPDHHGHPARGLPMAYALAQFLFRDILQVLSRVRTRLLPMTSGPRPFPR